MIYLVAYIAVIYLANWAIQAFGPVPVGFGLMAPAGVFFAGLAFTLRDLVQDRLGRAWTIVAILGGAAFSALLSPQFAFASGAAFLISEMLDYLVYTPLRKKNMIGAVAASNLVGLVVDSALFLWLAFGSFDFLAGQVVAKLWMTLLAVMVLWLMRRKSADGLNTA
ncbi:MAG: VUT family protein [Rhodospirillales bacterium]|nr:VUT family protein [Rhodospirillales bacterium]